MNVVEIIKNKDKFHHPTLVFCKYMDLVNNINLLLEKFGSNGTIMFTEKKALISFDECENIRLKVDYNKCFKTEDFVMWGEGFEIVGKGSDSIKSFAGMLIDDIKNNFIKILLIVGGFILIANPVTRNLEAIRLINDKLIEIIGFFIGMVFVFIGFFYGDKERTIEVYKKGLCDKEFKTDCYVINIAVVGLILSCVSLLLSNITSADVPNCILNNKTLSLFVNGSTRFWICSVLTSFVLTIVVVEFDTLTNYYLKTMRNKYFIEAFERTVNERKNKK